MQGAEIDSENTKVKNLLFLSLSLAAIIQGCVKTLQGSQRREGIMLSGIGLWGRLSRGTTVEPDLEVLWDITRLEEREDTFRTGRSKQTHRGTEEYGVFGQCTLWGWKESLEPNCGRLLIVTVQCLDFTWCSGGKEVGNQIINWAVCYWNVPSHFSPVQLCIPPDSSVQGILQARILEWEWVAMPSSRGSSRPRDRNCISCISCIAGIFFTQSHLGAHSWNSQHWA